MNVELVASAATAIWRALLAPHREPLPRAFLLSLLVIAHMLVVVCFTSCGQPRQDDASSIERSARVQGLAVAERFMRAVEAADSASIAATTTASYAADLRRGGSDSLQELLQHAQTSFRPGDLVRGADDLLLEFRYGSDAGPGRGYIRFHDENGLKVAGVLVVEH